MFPDDSFFLLVLSHFKFVLRLCTHCGSFTLPMHALNYWYSNVDRLILQDILRKSLTYHWYRKELNLPTVFACWKVLRTSLFQSRPSPFGQYPNHLTGVLLHTVRNLTQNDARPVGHLILCQNVSALQAKGFFKILSTLSMCTVFTGHCSYIRCFVGAFDSLWKSPRFLEWTILLEWTNLCKTAFQDLRYFGWFIGTLTLQ